MELEFAGVKTNKPVKWEDLFDIEYNNDGYLYLIGKEILHHDGCGEEEDFAFRFAIVATDMYRATNDPDMKHIHIQVCLAVEPSCWDEYLLKSVADMNGYDGVPYDEIRKSVTVQDMLGCGGIVTIGSDSSGYDEEEDMETGWYNILNNPDAVRKLNAAAAFAEFQKGHYAYMLDNPVNGIGTTGWEIVCGAVHGYDPYIATITGKPEKLRTAKP